MIVLFYHSCCPYIYYLRKSNQKHGIFLKIFLKIIPLQFKYIVVQLYCMSDDKYRTFGHAKTRLRYHMIFSTKFRRKCLEKIHDDVISSFKYAESKSNFKILVMELDKDHIHMLIEFKPKYSIEQVVSRLKQLTTNYLWKIQRDYLKKYYWKQHNILWTHGYFCSTIGDVSESTLKTYIENQG